VDASALNFLLPIEKKDSLLTCALKEDVRRQWPGEKGHDEIPRRGKRCSASYLSLLVEEKGSPIQTFHEEGRRGHRT